MEQNRAHYCLVDPALCTQRVGKPSLLGTMAVLYSCQCRRQKTENPTYAAGTMLLAAACGEQVSGALYSQEVNAGQGIRSFERNYYFKGEPGEKKNKATFAVAIIFHL